MNAYIDIFQLVFVIVSSVLITWLLVENGRQRYRIDFLSHLVDKTATHEYVSGQIFNVWKRLDALEAKTKRKKSR